MAIIRGKFAPENPNHRLRKLTRSLNVFLQKNIVYKAKIVKAIRKSNLRENRSEIEFLRQQLKKSIIIFKHYANEFTVIKEPNNLL